MRMVESFTENNFAQELWVLPIAEAVGVKATGEIVVTSIAGKAGTLPVYIAGRRVQIFVEEGEAIGVTAANIVKAINDDPSMPVIASQAGSDDPTVSLERKWAGVEGNDIDVRLAYGGLLAAEQIPFGLTSQCRPVTSCPAARAQRTSNRA